MEEYYVALFDDYTSMLPSSWLNFEKETLRWPPGPASKLKMKYLLPDHNWMEYKWKRIFGPYDFAKACRIEQETINMSTGDDSDLMKTPAKQLSGKRSRKRPAKYTPNENTSSGDDKSFDDEESDSENDKTEQSNYSIPPKKPKITILSDEIIQPKNILNDNEIYMSIPTSSTNSKNVSEKEDEYASLKDIEFQNENSFVENEVSPKRKGKPVRSNSKSRKGASTRTQPLGEINDPNNIVQVDVPEKENGEFAETTIESDDGESPEKKDASHVKNNSSVPKNSSGHKSSGKHGDKQLNDPDPDNQNKQYATLNDLKNLQKKIVRSNKRQELSQKGEVADEESDDIEKVLNLPLKTVAELKKFDVLLKNDANTRNKYKLMIRKIDGVTQSSFVYKSLARTMTNELALQYSYSGQTRGKNKEHKTLRFNNLQLYDILKRTIVYSKISFTELEYIRSVKRWLNYAKQRISQEKAKEAANVDSDISESETP